MITTCRPDWVLASCAAIMGIQDKKLMKSSHTRESAMIIVKYS